MTGRRLASTQVPLTSSPRIVVPRQRIAEQVGRLAGQINRHYHRQELTILGVVTGALIFLADLIRQLSMPLRLELICVSSYPGRAVRSRGPTFRPIPAGAVAARRVLIVDDILDTGQTLAELVASAERAGAEDVRTCVLFRKRRDDLPDRFEPDFVGLDVPDCFFVGYGLDFDERYRNLPDLCVLDDSVIPGDPDKGHQP